MRRIYWRKRLTDFKKYWLNPAPARLRGQCNPLLLSERLEDRIVLAAPVAVDDSAATTEDSPTAAINVLGNDSDADPGDQNQLSVTGINGVGFNADDMVILDSTTGESVTLITSGPDKGSLIYDPGSAFQSLAAGDTATPSPSFTYTVADKDGNTDTATVTVTVSGLNDSPAVTSEIADQTGNDGDTVSLDVSGNFSDVDGDSLSFSAEGLPTNLAIDSATGVITGTLTSDASQGGPDMDGGYDVTITAVDGNGGTVSDMFEWTISNPAPKVTSIILDQANNDGDTVSLNVSGNFSDVDGDTLSFSATGLPANLAIDSSTGVISGTLATNASQSSPYTVTVTADDGNGGSISDMFDWTVSNLVPVVSSPINTQDNNDGDAVSLDVSGNFSDPDGDTLTFSATGLPPNLTIDSSTGVISGTLATNASQNSPYSVKVTVSDGNGGTVSTTFNWSVNNLGPVVSSSISDRTDDEGETISLDVSGNFNDPDGDTLSFSATGLPSGLTINSATGVISGTLPSNSSQNSPYSVTVTVNDGNGGTVSTTFNWSVTNPSPVASPIDPQTNDDGDTVSLDVSGNFSDPDGDALSFSAAGLPPNLTIDSATGVISGTLPSDASQNSPYSVTVTVSDSDGGTVSVMFTWMVNNPEPKVVAIANQTNNDADTVSLDVSGNFSDPDGDTLSFSAAGLPPNLTISSTGVISGTLATDASQNSPYMVTVTASDGDGGTVSDMFRWRVNNPEPVALDIADQTSNDSDTVSLDVSGNFSDPDGDTLTFSAAGLPPNLTISSTGVISGILASDASQNSPYMVTVRADDGNGGTVSTTFNWSVTNPFPVASPIDPQTNNDGDTVSLDVSGNFSDPDGDTLIFSAAGLPPNLTISSTGVISGILASDASQNSPYTVTVRADDGNGGMISTTFGWTVANPPPTATNDSFTVSEDASAANNDLLNGNVLVNDSDPDGDDLRVSGVVVSTADGMPFTLGNTTLLASGALLTVNDNGTLIYDPNGAFENLAAGQTRVETFTYTITDDQGGTASATVRITIRGENDAPTLVSGDLNVLRDNELRDILNRLLPGSNIPDPLSIDVNINDILAVFGNLIILSDPFRLIRVVLPSPSLGIVEGEQVQLPVRFSDPDTGDTIDADLFLVTSNVYSKLEAARNNGENLDNVIAMNRGQVVSLGAVNDLSSGQLHTFLATINDDFPVTTTSDPLVFVLRFADSEGAVEYREITESRFSVEDENYPVYTVYNFPPILLGSDHRVAGISGQTEVEIVLDGNEFEATVSGFVLESSVPDSGMLTVSLIDIETGDPLGAPVRVKADPVADSTVQTLTIDSSGFPRVSRTPPLIRSFEATFRVPVTAGLVNAAGTRLQVILRAEDDDNGRSELANLTVSFPPFVIPQQQAAAAEEQVVQEVQETQTELSALPTVVRTIEKSQTPLSGETEEDTFEILVRIVVDEGGGGENDEAEYQEIELFEPEEEDEQESAETIDEARNRLEQFLQMVPQLPDNRYQIVLIQKRGGLLVSKTVILDVTVQDGEIIERRGQIQSDGEQTQPAGPAPETAPATPQDVPGRQQQSGQQPDDKTGTVGAVALPALAVAEFRKRQQKAGSERARRLEGQRQSILRRDGSLWSTLYRLGCGR